ncbi:MAG: DMT family transporter [Ardenticatenaceae bacterium]|nr:DMT family transporter [Ardenticatenaceae bacterium]
MLGNLLSSGQARGTLAITSTVVAAASAPIAIRYAQGEGVPSLTIIAYRLIITSAVLAPLVWSWHGKELRALQKSDWIWAFGSGLFHALGLMLLFFSLEYTSVLINSIMRRTSPLFALLLELIFFSAIFAPRVWWGVILAVVGAAVVGFGGDGSMSGSNDLLGGGLALLNAITISVYLFIGRKLRHQLPYLAYSWVVFTAAAVVASVGVLLTDSQVAGFSTAGYFWIIMVTLIAQFFGHIPINAALRYFSATILSVIMLLSVILAAVIAFFTLGEIPSTWQSIGSVIILVGIYLAVRKDHRPQTSDHR